MEAPGVYMTARYKVRAAARESGERTQVSSVYQPRQGLDRSAPRRHAGMRLQSVIRELRGEKVNYSLQ